MRLKQLIIYITGMMIYMMCIYLLNKRTKQKGLMYFLSVTSILVFSILKFIGSTYQIRFLGSEIFMNTYFLILCTIMYIPILIGGYQYSKYYIHKNNILSSKSFIIQGLSMLLIAVGAYLYFTWWYIAYYYLF